MQKEAGKSMLSYHKSNQIRVIAHIAVLTSLIAGTAAYGGSPIVTFGGNVGIGDVFIGDADSGEWNIPGNEFTSGSAVSAAPMPNNFWNVCPGAPGTFNWWDSFRESEYSSGGQAKALFFGGGKITIYGQVKNLYGIEIAPPGTLLLEADVSDFCLEEEYPDSNVIISPKRDGEWIRVHPTDGFLLDNTVLDGMNLVGDYYMSAFQVSSVGGEGDLVDFKECLDTDAGMQFTLTQVPEPGTALLFAGSLIILYVNRRKR